MAKEQQYPCGGFQELQQIPPGQIIAGQHPCIFNDIQRIDYVCPLDGDQYPKYCQEVYREITGLIADAEASSDKLEKTIEADKKASMSLKDKVSNLLKKKDGESEKV